jgi:hypothetical protein
MQTEPLSPFSCPRRVTRVIALALAALAGGCGDATPAGGTSTTGSAPDPAQAASAPAPSSVARRMPTLTVDNLGPYLDGQRIDMKAPDGPERLKKVVAGLPFDGKEVTLITLKKSKTRDVLAVVRELGASPAPSVRIKTDARNDLPVELLVIPSNKLTATPPACSVVATLGDDFHTRVWSVGGGLAKMQKKGMVGPDYSMTADAAKKDVTKCTSDVALFSGDLDTEWELTFNLGGAVWANANHEGKLKTLVLVVDPPVAGRPVKLP